MGKQGLVSLLSLRESENKVCVNRELILCDGVFGHVLHDVQVHILEEIVEVLSEATLVQDVDPAYTSLCQDGQVVDWEAGQVLVDTLGSKMSQLQFRFLINKIRVLQYKSHDSQEGDVIAGRWTLEVLFQVAE